MTDVHRNILGCRIRAKIGSGARTSIYEVDGRDGVRHALKHLKITSDSDRRFLVQMRHEHEVAAQFDHPCIRRTTRLRVRRRFFRPVEAGLLMEMVVGEPMHRADRGELSDDIDRFRQIAEGLATLHRHGWIHADIKPSNIICSMDGAVLIDLGQAARAGTVKQRVQGTPGFMAPEQARRELITPRTDLYGLGATMYWAFTGRTLSTAGVDPVHQGPVSGANDSVREVLEALRPELPETLVALVERCTADDPLKRPASVAEILGPLSRSGPRS